MLLFWGGKGINNSANIFAFAVKNDKSTRKKSEKPRQYSRHRLPLQEIKSVSADRIEYTQAFLPVYRHPPPCLSGTCLNARPFCYIDSRYVQSASYLKLHNLTLGYTIGKSQLSVLCKQSLSLLTHLHFWRKCDVIKVITYCLVCEMPRKAYRQLNWVNRHLTIGFFSVISVYEGRTVHTNRLSFPSSAAVLGVAVQCRHGRGHRSGGVNAAVESVAELTRGLFVIQGFLLGLLFFHQYSI